MVGPSLLLPCIVEPRGTHDCLPMSVFKAILECLLIVLGGHAFFKIKMIVFVLMVELL